MTTVLDLRSLVRTQTQTDPGDLPDSTIDSYLQQGFERTVNGETRWPFYAQSWELVQEPDAATMILAGDVNVPGIMTLAHKASGRRLEQVPQEYAEDWYSITPSGGQASAYSVWGRQVYLWPAATFTERQVYRLRGYRTPLAWLTPELIPDCDPRLHMALTHYATALAYAQQEDEVLEATYMQRWQQDAELARHVIMEPFHHRPLIGGGSINNVRYGIGGNNGSSIAIIPPVQGLDMSDEVWVGTSAPPPESTQFELWIDSDDNPVDTNDEVAIGPTAPSSGLELWVDTSMDP